MRIVLDTNVLIDAFSDEYSAQARLLAAVREGKITALITKPIEREYRLILRRLIADPSYQEKIVDFFSLAEPVVEQRVETAIDDPEDYKFLQAAAGGAADYLVTLDRHLLAVGEVDEVKIVTPQEAWAQYQEDSNDNSEWESFVRGVGIGAVLLVAVTMATPVVNASEADDLIRAKQEEITELTKQIEALRTDRDTKAAESAIITHQLRRLTTKLEQASAQLKVVESTLSDVKENSKATEKRIYDLEGILTEKQEQLRELIKQLYLLEQTPWYHLLVTRGSLGAIVSEQAIYRELQQRTGAVIASIREASQQLQQQQSELSQREQELTRLQQLLAETEQEVAAKQSQQRDFLSQTRQQQVKYEASLAAAERARAEIQQNLFTLRQGNVRVTLTSAEDMARHASQLTGVRAALLLAILKTESDVGNNVGNGTFPDNMPVREREAFVRITHTLGLDPAKTPIARSGAIGPGQFMPTTWEALEGRVAKLLGKTPNPYELADAFVATAVYIADRGGAQESGEYEAVARYVAGPHWQRFSWYADRVLTLAKEYEKRGI